MGWTPLLQGKWIGHYRVTWWHLDESDTQAADDGFAFAMDQEILDGVIFFFTYQTQDTNRTQSRQMLTTGFGIDGPLGQVDDFAGMGVAWGDPFNDALTDQFVIEIFYRIHASPTVEITPGIQGIFAPSLNAQDEVIGVFEIRIRISF
ncbi:MAG: carbohydrate porin [Planctomycetota bacterium]|nr:carbohydrate porin [Planctomycetota bacterium]